MGAKVVEGPEFAGFTRRILRAMGRRVAKGDVAALGDLVALRAEVDDVIAQTVATLRSEPHCYSWAQIGAELGITRQSAQERYGRLAVAGGRKAGGQPAHLR